MSGSPRRYRAFPAPIRARKRARRPRPREFAEGSAVRAEVVRRLRLDCPPGQDAGGFRRGHPDDRAMRVSRATICQARFGQGMGVTRQSSR